LHGLLRADASAAVPLDACVSRPLKGEPSFSIGSRLYRAAWRASWAILAGWTPPPLHRWRLFVLRRFGALVEPGARVYASVRIWDPRHLTLGACACLGPRVDCYAMAPISLGSYAIVSQDAVLCAGTHDIGDPDFQLVAKPIYIGECAWIAAGAFVGPGVHVGKGAVLGARAVAFSDLAPWEVYVGNPAQRLKNRAWRGSPRDPTFWG
jgi:putative colanic acid biosynthesis acetyltransferase WcaF